MDRVPRAGLLDGGLDYGAPNPAALFATEGGTSDLLVKTEGLEKGEDVRGGDNNEETFTEYTGTVPADLVENVIPSATGDDFEVSYLVSSDGELREAKITGEFYPDSDEMTYTIELDNYGTEKDIPFRESGPGARPIRTRTAGTGRRRGGLRRSRHLRRRSGAARHDDHGRRPGKRAQRAAPIVSGFLLGYVAMLPLIGRMADLPLPRPGLGDVPLLVFSSGVPGHVLLRPGPWWSAGSFRGSAAADWCRRRWRWSPISTSWSAAAYPRHRVSGPGDRQRHRPAVRRRGAGRRGMAGHLHDQPGRRRDPGGRAAVAGRLWPAGPSGCRTRWACSCWQSPSAPLESSRSGRSAQRDLTWGQIFIPYAGDGAGSPRWA